MFLDLLLMGWPNGGDSKRQPFGSQVKDSIREEQYQPITSLNLRDWKVIELWFQDILGRTFLCGLPEEPKLRRRASILAGDSPRDCFVEHDYPDGYTTTQYKYPTYTFVDIICQEILLSEKRVLSTYNSPSLITGEEHDSPQNPSGYLGLIQLKIWYDPRAAILRIPLFPNGLGKSDATNKTLATIALGTESFLGKDGPVHPLTPIEESRALPTIFPFYTDSIRNTDLLTSSRPKGLTCLRVYQQFVSFHPSNSTQQARAWTSQMTIFEEYLGDSPPKLLRQIEGNTAGTSQLGSNGMLLLAVFDRFFDINDLNPDVDCPNLITEQLLRVFRFHVREQEFVDIPPAHNVDSVIKIFHIPTIGKVVRKIQNRITSLDATEEALIFVIFFAAVTSMAPDEASDEETTLLTHYPELLHLSNSFHMEPCWPCNSGYHPSIWKTDDGYGCLFGFWTLTYLWTMVQNQRYVTRLRTHEGNETNRPSS
ncbi:all development altered-3 [Colletotrichum cuscutae]|uniref:All development altered-3 n=1 Tax=Colletotrichum cuscutae TaxID=1209917 RepID=A0AAI9U520_9PEZI|nr:all development altered-3 [Colletotrichum cuscutae]